MNEKNEPNDQNNEPAVKGASKKWFTFDEWLEQFKPAMREPSKSTPQDVCFIETDEANQEFVKARSNDRIWTLVDCGGEAIIVPGYKDSGTVGYFVCDVPWNDELVRVVYMTRRFVTTPRPEDADIVEDEEYQAKLTVGADCNRLLDLADFLDNSTKLTDQELADVIRFIVNRVRDFDELVWGDWQLVRSAALKNAVLASENTVGQA